MDQFLEMYNLQRLNQEEVENMNTQIISKEIDSVIEKFLTNKSRTRELHRWFLPNINNYLSQPTQKKIIIIGRNTFEFIL